MIPNPARFLESFVEPIGLVWWLHIFGAIWAARLRKRREAIFCVAVALLITAVGSTSLPNHLLATLERPYAKTALADVPDADAVVMLGGLLSPSAHDTFRFQLGDAADRAVTAAELFRLGKAKTLVLGGGGGRRAAGGTNWLEGALLTGWFKTWAVATTNVVQLDFSRNTRDEAEQVRALAKAKNWQRVILVTSAYHMKRAEGIFRRLDVPVIPVACDFIGLSALERGGDLNPIPTSDGFGSFEIYLHEKIGWFYYRWRGWVAKS